MNLPLHLICVLSLSVNSLCLAQGLVAFYPFDNHANDISPNKNNGRIIGGVIGDADRFGNPCGALRFNGIDGFIEVANSRSLQSITGPFTVTCWFKIGDAVNGLKGLTLVCKGTGVMETADNPQFRVQTFQSGTQSTVSINTALTEYDENFLSHLFESDSWNFYALVYDGSIIKTYLNKNKIWEFPFYQPLDQNSEPMHIGKDIPGAIEYFDGSLDDLRIYNTPLSEKTILTLFNDDGGASFEDEFVLSCPSNISASTSGTCGARVSYTKPQLDINCGTASLKQISGLASGSVFPVGESWVSFEAVGRSGYQRTCSFKITVVDRTPPVISCSGDTTLMITDQNQNDIVVRYSLPKAADECSSAEVVLVSGGKSGSRFPIGLSNLRFKATDKAGNTVECTRNIVVQKKQALSQPVVHVQPTLTPPQTTVAKLVCPADVNKRNDTGKCGAVVNYAIVGDENLIKLVNGRRSGSFFPVGGTINKFMNGVDSIQCSFKVSVIDAEKPELACPNDVVVYLPANQTTTKVSFRSPSAADNCKVDGLTQISGPKSGESFSKGVTQIVFKAVDPAGNLTNCSFNVTVIDTITSSKSLPPQVKLQPKDVEVKPELMKDSIRYITAMDFKTCIVTVVMYDDKVQDFDSVSIFFNKKEIVVKEAITLKKNGIITRALMLNAGEKNDFIVKAWNTGQISPNTLKIEFHNGYFMDNVRKLKNRKPDMIRILHSKPGYAAAIYLNCKNQQ